MFRLRIKMRRKCKDTVDEFEYKKKFNYYTISNNLIDKKILEFSCFSNILLK